MRIPIAHYSVLAVAFLCSGFARAGDRLPSEFTLGRYIPADAWMYVHGVDNPERHWIDDRWTDVIRTVVDSGVGEDIKNLVFPLIPAEHRGEVEKHLDRLWTSIQSVKWTELVRHEFVFAERISSGGLSYDYVALMRGERESAKQNFKALSDILGHLAGLTDEMGVQSIDADGIRVLALGARDKGAEKLSKPFVWLIHKDDVIGFTVAPPVGDRKESITDDILGMMSGKKKVASIVDSPRFREALKHVDTPNDAITYFDIKTLFSNLRNMFDRIGRHVSEEKAADRSKVDAIAKLLGHANFTDYVINSYSTKGLRNHADEYTKFQADKKDRPLARMCFDRQPFERFDQYIPKNATSFSLSAGVDMEILYDFAIGFLKDDFPGGSQVVGQIESLLGQIGFDPKRDLFSWWSGESIEVSLPASIVTPMGGSSDWAMMIRVKNPDVASCRVNDAIDWVNRKLQQRGQTLMVSPANCKVGSFREVTHPMLAMMMRPVVGVQDDWLVIAKSADAVNKCTAVAKGDAPSIMKNKRFREEGLIPEGPIQSLSFEDLSRRGDEWAGAAAAFGMIGGMAAGMMPPDTPQEIRGLVQSVTGIIAKLAPALKRVDFYSSQSSIGAKEGESAYRKRTLVTYKAPTKSKEKVAGEPR